MFGVEPRKVKQEGLLVCNKQPFDRWRSIAFAQSRPRHRK